MDYPKEKLVICVCDDGKNRDDVRALVDAVREENKARGNHVVLRYFRRVKEVGKPHHAKVNKSPTHPPTHPRTHTSTHPHTHTPTYQLI